MTDTAKITALLKNNPGLEMLNSEDAQSMSALNLFLFRVIALTGAAQLEVLSRVRLYADRMREKFGTTSVRAHVTVEVCSLDRKELFRSVVYTYDGEPFFVTKSHRSMGDSAGEEVLVLHSEIFSIFVDQLLAWNAEQVNQRLNEALAVQKARSRRPEALVLETTQLVTKVGEGFFQIAGGAHHLLEEQLRKHSGFVLNHEGISVSPILEVLDKEACKLKVLLPSGAILVNPHEVVLSVAEVTDLSPLQDMAERQRRDHYWTVEPGEKVISYGNGTHGVNFLQHYKGRLAFEKRLAVYATLEEAKEVLDSWGIQTMGVLLVSEELVEAAKDSFAFPF